VSAVPIRHHPPDTLLLDYATGALPKPLALLIGGHLDFCPACRALTAGIEDVGGEVLRRMPPAPLDDATLETCLSRLDEPADGAAETTASVPATLSPHLPGDPTQWPWRSVGGVFDEVKLPELSPSYRTSVIKVAPGGHVPEHAHEGHEFMLVLAGGYTSAGKHYARGDVAICDAREQHMPVADEGEEPCICLLVLDAPLSFVDAEGRALEPMLRP